MFFLFCLDLSKIFIYLSSRRYIKVFTNKWSQYNDLSEFKEISGSFVRKFIAFNSRDKKKGWGGGRKYTFLCSPTFCFPLHLPYKSCLMFPAGFRAASQISGLETSVIVPRVARWVIIHPSWSGLLVYLKFESGQLNYKLHGKLTETVLKEKKARNEVRSS